jgi:cation transport regulator
MPYNKRSELPDQVKDNVPPHAQDIYKEAFNNALDQYGDESRAHATAWSAVKEKYTKDDDSGKWRRKKNN